MYQTIQLTSAIPPATNSLSPATAGRGFLLIPLAIALAWLALSPAPKAFGVTPAPDGGYPNGNTAEGDFALNDLTTGAGNTAIGDSALFSDTTGNGNTANGYQALFSNTTGDDNTANGAFTLQINTTGSSNTANGEGALFSNTTGNNNTATGADALVRNRTGSNNTATGVSALGNNTTGMNNTTTGADALFSNTTGSGNVSNGFNALLSNTTGNANTADGQGALSSNTTGGFNTANGWNALRSNTTGGSNIALGVRAGLNLTTGSNNIDIGNIGVASDAAKIRIGTVGTQNATFIAGIRGASVASGVGVIVGSNGQLGTVVSSKRFKDQIKPMDKASEAILALQPVTFRYKHELDPEGIPQFGLVAEQVEKVNADLVVRDTDGKVNTVRYEAVNAMLLNEFLKEHRKVEEQGRKERELEATIAQQQKDFQSTIAKQQKQIEVLTATVQKVSDQLELSRPASKVVVNNQPR